MWQKKKNGFADRGKFAEGEVKKFLKKWGDGYPGREWNRLVDSRAAMRIIDKAKADFDFYRLEPDHGVLCGLLEVKSTEHEYRLQRSKVTQLPDLVKRSKCGAYCGVLVYFSTLKVWKFVHAETLERTGDKGSWDLRHLPEFATPGEALAFYIPRVFE